MSKLTKEQLAHPVAKVSGVTAADSKIEAVDKALAVMKAAGFSSRDIRKAEAIRDELIRRDRLERGLH